MEQKIERVQKTEDRLTNSITAWRQSSRYTVYQVFSFTHIHDKSGLVFEINVQRRIRSD